MIDRSTAQAKLLSRLGSEPIVCILGPRQCGKTTLARQVAARFPSTEWFDLEDPADAGRLSAAPREVLGRLRGLVVLDEIQSRPDLFPLLRVLADRPGLPARFLILGSASPHLAKGASESLAGRVSFVDLGGFTLDEVQARHPEAWRTLWLRGGFPRSFLASSAPQSARWRSDFIRTFLLQDLARLGFDLEPERIRRFWTMLAHYHGQVWNASEIAGSLGISHPTATRYLDILCGAYMVRSLQPWHANLGKRQRKAAKVYVRDSGLFHSLLGIGSQAELESHPKLGASWEGLAIEQVLTAVDAQPGEAFYWATHAGAEIDLLLHRAGKLWGFECKFADAPRSSRSLFQARQSLELEHTWVLYPGNKAYPLADGIDVLPLAEVAKTLPSHCACAEG